MKNTVKTLLITAGLFQGTMAFAKDIEKIIINSGGSYMLGFLNKENYSIRSER